LETWGCNGTKSAFADCSVGILATRGRSWWRRSFCASDGTRAAYPIPHHARAGESAKADFVLFKPGFL